MYIDNTSIIKNSAFCKRMNFYYKTLTINI